MRRHLSVFGLWVRCSLYKILVVIAIMGLAEYMLFYFTMKNGLSVYEATQTFARPENIIDTSGIFVCFAVAFLIITALISVYGCQFGAKTGYTLQRLSISEKYVFLYQCVYNLTIYILLWSSQVILCFLMLREYTVHAPTEFWGEQSIYLAFYRSTRLHALLPLSDVTMWVRNALLLVCLALVTAEFPYLQRRGKKSFTVVALALYTVALWKQDITPIGSMVSMVFVAIVVLSAVCYQLFLKEDTNGDNQDVDY